MSGACTGRLQAVLAVIAMAVATGAAAQSTQPTQSDLMSELKRLSERLAKLEQRNAELEALLKISAPGSRELEERVKALEAYKAAIEAGLAKEGLSEKEPELTTRLFPTTVSVRAAGNGWVSSTTVSACTRASRYPRTSSTSATQQAIRIGVR